MKKIEYIYKSKGCIHVLQTKEGQNSKLGFRKILTQTYHFDEEQVKSLDFSKDKKNCLNCPLSQSNNEPGENSCYTHKGLQRAGLESMLARLNRIQDSIKGFSRIKFEEFLEKTKQVKPELVRFGTYGEPTLLSTYIVENLSKVGKNYTGYTHTWPKTSMLAYAKFFMASTHSVFETLAANDMGWRVFNTGILESGSVNCPASKEAGKKTVCAKCGLCSGTEGKGKTNIHINMH